MSSKTQLVSIKQFVWKSPFGEYRLNTYNEHYSSLAITITITETQAKELIAIGVTYHGSPIA